MYNRKWDDIASHASLSGSLASDSKVVATMVSVALRELGAKVVVQAPSVETGKFIWVTSLSIFLAYVVWLYIHIIV